MWEIKKTPLRRSLRLPNINGSVVSGNIFNYAMWVGAFTCGELSTGNIRSGQNNGVYQATFDAHNSNSIYTDSGKVYPLSLALNFIIKS